MFHEKIVVCHDKNTVQDQFIIEFQLLNVYPVFCNVADQGITTAPLIGERE